jgi:hypothetical protein
MIVRSSGSVRPKRRAVARRPIACGNLATLRSWRTIPRPLGHLHVDQRIRPEERRHPEATRGRPAGQADPVRHLADAPDASVCDGHSLQLLQHRLRVDGRRKPFGRLGLRASSQPMNTPARAVAGVSETTVTV